MTNMSVVVQCLGGSLCLVFCLFLYCLVVSVVVWLISLFVKLSVSNVRRPHDR